VLVTTPSDPSRPPAPSAREIAELTARLRALTAQGAAADSAERAAYLAEKEALLARIADAADSRRGSARVHAEAALADAVLARAAQPGYVLIGPSARTWLRDPVTGHPATPVCEAEHRAVRELLGREVLAITNPEWVTGPDGQPDVHATVVRPDRESDSRRDPNIAGITKLDLDRHGLRRLDGLAMPEEMRAAAAEWGPAGPPPGGRVDDPIELAERIGKLRASLDAPPWAEEVVSPAQAAQRLTELGYDQASAQAMVSAYLDDTSRVARVPTHRWGLNQRDVDAIREQYRRVDDHELSPLPRTREAANHAEDAATVAAGDEPADTRAERAVDHRPPRRWADPHEPVADYPGLLRDGDGFDWRHVGEPGQGRYWERGCTEPDDGMAAGGWADMRFPLTELDPPPPPQPVDKPGRARGAGGLPAPRAGADEEAERRAQLGAWHADDQAALDDSADDDGRRDTPADGTAWTLCGPDPFDQSR
jgi:hypothetical protein